MSKRPVEESSNEPPPKRLCPNENSTTAPLRVLSLFSGIGAFERALLECGVEHEIIGFSEIDAAAVQIYQAHFPQAPALGDATAIDWAALGRVDLIVGGPPCQGLSGANPRGAGLDDPRSALLRTFVAAVRALRPRYFVCENVASMSRAWRDVIDAEFAAVGGRPGVEVNAARVGLQARRRLFWANFDIAPLVLADGEVPPGDFTSALAPLDEVQNLTLSAKARAYMEGSPGGGRATRWLLCQHHDTAMPRARTIPRDVHKGVPYNVLIDRRADGPPLIRHLRPDEIERLFGFPTGWTEGPCKTARLKALGNSIVVPAATYVLRSGLCSFKITTA